MRWLDRSLPSVFPCPPSPKGVWPQRRETRLCEAVVAYEFKRGKRRTIGMAVGADGLVVSAPRWVPLYEVEAALQEDAGVIGLSILSGAHNHVCPRVMELLREKGLDDVLVVLGGIIPDVDLPRLRAIGIEGVFQPGTPMRDIVGFIREHHRRIPA